MCSGSRLRVLSETDQETKQRTGLDAGSIWAWVRSGRNKTPDKEQNKYNLVALRFVQISRKGQRSQNSKKKEEALPLSILTFEPELYITLKKQQTRTIWYTTVRCHCMLPSYK